jgi:hypothetical protein
MNLDRVITFNLKRNTSNPTINTINQTIIEYILILNHLFMINSELIDDYDFGNNMIEVSNSNTLLFNHDIKENNELSDLSNNNNDLSETFINPIQTKILENIFLIGSELSDLSNNNNDLLEV